MKTKRTIETFFQRAIFRYAGIGFFSMVLILGAASFLLARQQAATDLQESAKATAEAFNDRILDGDIRSVEAQIRDVLMLKDSEVVKVLKADQSKIYAPVEDNLVIHPCPSVGITCFDGYFGKARIEYPISMDSINHVPFRYLYLSRSVQLNWSFLATVFFVFSIIYAALIFGFLRISKIASLRLGSEIQNWSDQIRENPKDASPRQKVPFSELLPLKSALEGLNEQIMKFEQDATDRTRLIILRGIAHDLLTPVSQLQLNLATLEAQVAPGQHQELLNDIRDSLKRVTGIASQVKTLRETPDAETTELVSAVESEVKALAESDLFFGKNISLDFSSDTKAVSSPFSKTDISRILLNLVQNAVDASKDGSAINVSVKTDHEVGRLIVSDAGKGISKSAQPKVFDPEFTLKPGTGTGLGLAVVKYICEKRSAKIDLKSELNKGTTISIRFPVCGVNHV